MTPQDPPVPQVTAIVCTYNRADLIAGAIDALLGQEPDTPPYQVIVVDNNSSDGTASVVRTFAADTRLRYLREPEQGVSAARNLGIAHARAPIVAFIDDDVRADPNWIKTIVRTFAAHPEATFIGGKVLPIWQAPPPDWLESAGTAPLALVDYGTAGRQVTTEWPVCLVSANLAIRRTAFDRVGLFSTVLQRVGNSIGSIEDQELEMRLVAAGCAGWYEPSLTVHALVPLDRLRREYHRAWHLGHGRFYALLRDPSFERSRRTVLGVPLHLFQAAAASLFAWTRDLLRRRSGAAFAHELRLRFMLGFVRQRIRGRHHA
jgi:glucosyl-dolichyl phosphate glucuronosyltransferase